MIRQLDQARSLMGFCIGIGMAALFLALPGCKITHTGEDAVRLWIDRVDKSRGPQTKPNDLETSFVAELGKRLNYKTIQVRLSDDVLVEDDQPKQIVKLLMIVEVIDGGISQNDLKRQIESSLKTVHLAPMSMGLAVIDRRQSRWSVTGHLKRI